MAYKKIYCIVEQRKYTKHDKSKERREITEFDAKKIATRLLEIDILNESSYDVKFDMIEPDSNSNTQRLSSSGIQKELFDTFKNNENIPKEFLDAYVGLDDAKLYQQTLGSKAFYENTDIKGKKITRKVGYLLRKARALSKYDVVYHDVFYITDAHLPVEQNTFLTSIYSPQHLQEKIDNTGRARKSWVVTYETDF